MNLYTVRARTVEALQVTTHTTREDVADFVPRHTEEWYRSLRQGDFIVKDTLGRFSVVPSEIFLATHDPIAGGHHR